MVSIHKISSINTELISRGFSCWISFIRDRYEISPVSTVEGRRISERDRLMSLVEDGIAEGLQNWFKVLTYLYVDLIETRPKRSPPEASTEENFVELEKALREQRLNTIYTVQFYIDSFFSMASAIIELQKFTRYLRVRRRAMASIFVHCCSSFRKYHPWLKHDHPNIHELSVIFW